MFLHTKADLAYPFRQLRSASRIYHWVYLMIRSPSVIEFQNDYIADDAIFCPLLNFKPCIQTVIWHGDGVCVCELLI
jgi:hypothetical protein